MRFARIFWLCILSFAACKDAPSKAAPHTETSTAAEAAEAAEVKTPGPKISAIPADQVTIEKLVGIWKLKELRMTRDGDGIPIGEGEDAILMQITADKSMAFATEGLEELAENIEGIPVPLTVRRGFMCSKDGLFKLHFKKACARVVGLTDTEMLVAIQIPSEPGELSFLFKNFAKMP